MPSALRDEGQKVALTVAGRRYTFAKAAQPLLEVLVDARVLTVAELAERAGAEVETAAALARVLVQHHLVLLRSTS